MAHSDFANDTELTDSLLHTNVPRIIVGILCGLASGLLMLVLTTATANPGMPKTWWLSLLATSVYGDAALNFEITQQFFVAGLAVHIFLSCLHGFLMGKMTRTSHLGWLCFYGLVLGGLGWLASNMFGPNVLSQMGLAELGQWHRILLFGSFGLILGVFMSFASKTLKV